jgi:hypothetical protein
MAGAGGGEMSGTGAASAGSLGSYFHEQYLFVHSLTQISEQMRFVDRRARTARLPAHLLQLVLPALVYIPLCNGTDRFARIVRIPVCQLIPGFCVSKKRAYFNTNLHQYHQFAFWKKISDRDRDHASPLSPRPPPPSP